MTNFPVALSFVCMTFIAWGTYGILLHHGQEEMGHSSMRSFVGVGIAYFLVAVLVPAFLLSRGKEKGSWTVGGTLLSLFAGAVGALGAFGVLLALKFGKPIFVMPLVFGFAPVVNTLVSTWLNKSFKQINPIFVVGMLLVACGAVGVLLTKPKPGAKPAANVEKLDSEASATKGDSEGTSSEAAGSESKEGAGDRAAESSPSVEDSKSKPEKTATASSTSDVWKVVLSVIMAALCWGSYAPFLHLGQTKMGGSRLRPFFCVGMSYFAIAVVAPIAFLAYFPEQGDWTASGMTWSIAAGAAGAIGALGIIMAFNFGGKPIFVMPLVFGFAPVVNTLIAVYLANSFSQLTTEFLLCLGTVIVGAVTVLIFAPKSKPHAPAAPAT